MNTRLLAMIVSTLSLSALAACNKAEAPADTASDVAEARQEANEDVADARKDAANEMGSAAADMRESAQDVEETRIEGDHKVALEKCESLAGDAQKACKDSADATYESAKARLKTQMSNSDASGTAAAPGTSAAPASSSTDTTSPGTATPKR
jgi:vacuolar-type H+-ATPase subunit H